MTDKEKQIEEMARVICDGCAVCNHVMCHEWYTAKKVYDAGYRKQNDVIDELVMELKDFLDDTYSTGEDVLIEIHDIIDHIAQKMKGGDKEFRYRIGIVCGELVYETRKYDDFDAVFDYLEQVDEKYGHDMQYCSAVIQAYKDDSYDYKSACFYQKKMPIRGIRALKDRVREEMLEKWHESDA